MSFFGDNRARETRGFNNMRPVVGGTASSPPPLSDFLGSSKTAANIDEKLSVLYTAFNLTSLVKKKIQKNP